MTKIINTINGVKIEVDIEKVEYFKFFPEGEKLTDSLVQYNHDANIVTVDTRASDQYAMWAGTHEAICCGPYKHLAPKAPELDRCGKIDVMLIELMPEDYRSEYQLKRLEMFETLIEKNLTPHFTPSFKRSIEILEES